MVTFSPYPADPRPRRAAAALLQEDMSVDLVCLADDKAPRHERLNGLDVIRVPIRHRRGGKLSYAYQYCAFILVSAGILAWRSLKRRYDLVYIHNMPDILVVSALFPKVLGAKVILDMHDPMPELMTTIFDLDPGSTSVRLMRFVEKWSIACTDAVITVNLACKEIFSSRSCSPEKITVVMNSPDEQIFSFRDASVEQTSSQPANKRFVIMYHGSLVDRNGLDLAVEALALMHESVPAVDLRIYGKATPFLERVLDLVREKGLQERVHYFGPKRLEDLVPAIADCDLGIIPNHRNAFTEINTPTRILEYLALGKPVIAPRTRGVQDYFAPDTLIFFEPGNAVDLARKIEYVVSHPGEAIESASRGQQVYLAHAWSRERQAAVMTVTNLLKGRSRGDC